MTGFVPNRGPANKAAANLATGRRPSARVVIKYALLQIPGTALLVLVMLMLREWLDLPNWLAWSVVAVWVGKDVVLFPFVWRSYDPDFPAHALSLVGEVGSAWDRLAPSGYIRVRGELWRAEVIGGGQPINRGKRVRVREVRGLTLLVESED